MCQISQQSRTTLSSHHQLHEPRCTHSAFLLVTTGNRLFSLSKIKDQIPTYFTFLRALYLQFLFYFQLLINFSLFTEKLFRIVVSSFYLYNLSSLSIFSGFQFHHSTEMVIIKANNDPYVCQIQWSFSILISLHLLAVFDMGVYSSSLKPLFSPEIHILLAFLLFGYYFSVFSVGLSLSFA